MFSLIKKLFINFLKIFTIIHKKVNSYIFIDIVYVNSRKRKDAMLADLNQLIKLDPPDEIKQLWAISYRVKFNKIIFKRISIDFYFQPTKLLIKKSVDIDN